MSQDINVTFPNNDTFQPGTKGGAAIGLTFNITEMGWENQLNYIYKVATNTATNTDWRGSGDVPKTTSDNFIQILKETGVGGVRLYDPPGEPVKSLKLDLFSTVPTISGRGFRYDVKYDIANDWVGGRRSAGGSLVGTCQQEAGDSGNTNCRLGKINMTSINKTLSSLHAGYIKESASPTPTPNSPTPTPNSPTPTPTPTNSLWNGLSIAMTCIAGIFLIIILMTQMKASKKRPVLQKRKL